MLKPSAILYRLIVSCGCLVVLTACLPEDSFFGLEFSPDGQLTAIISEKKGLVVADPAALESRQIAPPPINPCGIAWTDDSLKIAYASKAEGSLDIYLASLDGLTTRVTSQPSRESNAMISGNNLLYLSTDTGLSELTSAPLASQVEPGMHVLPDIGGSIVEPAISPLGRYIAAFGFTDLRPQLYCLDMHTGNYSQLTSETDPLNLLVGPLAWKRDESAVGYLRKEATASDGIDNSGDILATLPAEQRGTSFVIKNVTTASEEVELVVDPGGIRHPRFLHDGSVAYITDHKLWISQPEGTKRQLQLDLQAAYPEPGGDGGEIAFVAAHQLLGLTTASLERARILTFDLQEKFLLAEEYFRSGSSAKSLHLYEELAASVQRTRDPEMAKFVYIANLRRLGETQKAVAEIEKLVAQEKTPDSVPERYVWRLLGFSYLLELDNLNKARDSLEKYALITSQTAVTEEPDSALNALEILRETSAPISRLYARAVKARLNGNFAETDRLFGELLTTAPHVQAVQREYINALEGFDREVYYFSPSQRPFNPSRSQQADYLQRFVTVVPDSPFARTARLELFLIRIEMGSFSRARELLIEALQAGPENSQPDGILEVFYNYLETPEPQPWINQAMPEVFLHPDIRPRLEALITAPEDRLLMGVVATKMALVQNDPDKARKEADAALTQWNRLDKNQQSGDLASLYGRLLVLLAREAELRGLFSEAAEEYDQALAMLMEKQVDNFEFQEEVRYRAGLLRMLVSDYPDMLPRLREIELRTGTELVNPTWETEVLAGAVREFVNLYDTTSGTLRLWAAYEASVQLAKLKRVHQARSGLILTSSSAAPEFLQRKAMLELAAIDAYQDDPWNAGRSYARLAALPSTSADVRLWCSFQIARLHLSINHKISAAREALALIVSTRPDTPLAIQAQELLLSTSTR